MITVDAAGDGQDDSLAPLRRALLRMGQMRFGLPSPEIMERIDEIEERAVLVSLVDRILDVGRWDDLFE
jgi:hypothetical protein